MSHVRPLTLRASPRQTVCFISVTLAPLISRCPPAALLRGCFWIYIYVLLILGSKGSLSLSQRGFPASSLSIANFFCLSVAFITNSYTLTLVVRRTFSNNTNKRHCSSSQICLAVSTQNNLLIYSVFGAAIASKRQQVAIIERSEG